MVNFERQWKGTLRFQKEILLWEVSKVPRTAPLTTWESDHGDLHFWWTIEHSALLIGEIKNQCTVFPSAWLLSKWVIWPHRCALGFTRWQGTTQPSFEQNGSEISKHPGSWAHIMLICGTLGVILWLYQALLPGFMKKRWQFRLTEDISKEASCSHFY